MPSWTPEMIDLLKLRVKQGLFRSEIARELGVTKNAVIGKVNRLGLGEKEKPPATLAATRSSAEIIDIRRLEMLRKAARGELPDIDYGCETLAFDRTINVSQRRTFAQLEDRMCRWPVGNPQQAGFFFCGGVATHKSYCAYHAWAASPESELAQAA